MANRTAKITQAEISRAVRAVQDVGLPVVGLEVDPLAGTVKVFTGDTPAMKPTGNEIDDMIASME